MTKQHTTEIFDIIQEINIENGSNYKLSVLKKYSENELLKRVLHMTYDNVVFTYGVTVKQIKAFNENNSNTNDESSDLKSITLSDALFSVQSEICSRNITGHSAYKFIIDLNNRLSEKDSDIFLKVIDRDLKINLGKTQINKVWKNLITKPVYMRCGVYNEKTKEKIKYPAYIQLKADGTYREFNVFGNTIETRSRTGESYTYPLIEDIMKDFPDGIYHGELTVFLDDKILERISPEIKKNDHKNSTNYFEQIMLEYEHHKNNKTDYILPRSIGNGLINSDNPPHENIKLELWDYVSHNEYENARIRVKNKTIYDKRFEELKNTIKNTIGSVKTIDVIPHKIVDNPSDALKQVSEWMKHGFEGGVLKDKNMIFRDGTSPQQLKMKLEIDADLRCVGFKEGSVGTKRECKIGSLKFASDDGQIQGFCSGFSDNELDEISENFDKYNGKIMAIQFNDITKARGNNFFALSHPRFIEWRDDKTESDTIQRVKELKEMAMCLS